MGFELRYYFGELLRVVGSHTEQKQDPAFKRGQLYSHKINKIEKLGVSLNTRDG